MYHDNEIQELSDCLIAMLLLNLWSNSLFIILCETSTPR